MITAVVGLSLQDTLGNLFAGLALHLEKTVQVGDMVRVVLQCVRAGRGLYSECLFLSPLGAAPESMAVTSRSMAVE